MPQKRKFRIIFISHIKPCRLYLQPRSMSRVGMFLRTKGSNNVGGHKRDGYIPENWEREMIKSEKADAAQGVKNAKGGKTPRTKKSS